MDGNTGILFLFRKSIAEFLSDNTDNEDGMEMENHGYESAQWYYDRMEPQSGFYAEEGTEEQEFRGAEKHATRPD